MILTSRLATGQPNLASNMMMDTLTAVVLLQDVRHNLWEISPR